jgi:cellulose synthase/poly-beta-1,6-N-acetylglucosamine synthase-like glycosyltransferase
VLAVLCVLLLAPAASASASVAGTGPVAAGVLTAPAVWVLYCLLSLASAAIATLTLVWMLHAWRTPAGLERTRFRGMPASEPMSFSLLVPGRHEEAVLGSTLSRLATLDHPDYEVLAIVGHDDPGTHAVAEEVAKRHPGRVRVVVDHSWPKSKPKALNTALPLCRGDAVGVFDAEDDVHPGLLAKVERQFGHTGAHVVQGGVQLMNHDSSWYSLRNVLEYFFWFASRLHFHAEQRFIPLGGNTVFVRTALLRAVDGWDPECLAEDCELGVRLSALGARTVVAYEPEFVTREETPDSLSALTKQRTRWSQGFLQVLRKGDWRRLPRRQRLLGLYTLSTPFLQAFSGLLTPVACATGLFLNAPVPVVLISFVPLVPTLIILAAEVAALGHFCRVYGNRPRALDYVRLVLSFFPYQAVLSYAAVRATVREMMGVRNWEKTAHIGAHLDAGVRA